MRVTTASLRSPWLIHSSDMFCARSWPSVASWLCLASLIPHRPGDLPSGVRQYFHIPGLIDSEGYVVYDVLRRLNIRVVFTTRRPGRKHHFYEIRPSSTDKYGYVVYSVQLKTVREDGSAPRWSNPIVVCGPFSRSLNYFLTRRDSPIKSCWFYLEYIVKDYPNQPLPA